ncbi:MAG: hypothetical protein A4E59_01379 [Syntrophorhabdus sp. PtaB.Bin027]|nr:MAG: hypothetical protein A4E59_01379 [Syntrophorhabdus sp. PtaB.Bin027]
MGLTGLTLQKPCSFNSRPNLVAIKAASFGGFMPTDRITISNSSSFTPASGVEYRTVTFFVTGSSFPIET